MKFLLSCNKGFVCFLIKGDISKDSCCNKGSDLFDLSKDKGTEGSTTIDVVGGESVMVGVLICSRYILKALTRVA